MMRESISTKNDGKNLIIINANIITLDKNFPNASALVSSNGKIIFVGDSKEALKYRNPSSELIDLKDKTVLPGLIDAHAHVLGLGKSLIDLDLRETKSLDELLEKVRQRKVNVEKEKWILGRGWDQNKWAKKEFPVHTKLSELIPENPVFLKRIDGHAVLVNKKALEIAKIDNNTKDPEGGKIIRFESGEPTGILIDNAVLLVEKLIPEMTLNEITEAIIKTQESCLSIGLTEIHDAGILENEFKAYKELGQEGKLKMRIYAMVSSDSNFYEKVIKEGPQISLFGGKLTLRTVKIFADGALGSRGALLTEPYSDSPSNSGLLVTSIEKMEKVTLESLAKGFQVATHAIGDKANHITIDVYEEALKKVSANDPRLRIEHVQVIQPSDVIRMKRLGIIASMQPTHCTSDMPWAKDRLGKERIKWAYAWRSILDNDITFASGSDSPVESNNPLLGIYAAVTRQDGEGNPKGGFYPEQKMTIYEALESFTKGAAYSAFEENIKGEIKVGKVADFTVLSKDILNSPPEDILKTKVLMTIVGGQVAYKTEL